MSTSTPNTMLVQLTAAELRALIRDELRAARDEYDAAPTEPALADMDGLCAFLATSRKTAMKLIGEGLPHVRVGDCRRFDLASVRAWLAQRGAA